MTKMTVRNFKRFDEVEVELGNPVVFVGPNNMGKTAALQALYLWGVGLKKWLEKKGEKTPSKRKGVLMIPGRDLLAIPVPGARQLWRNLVLREGAKHINIEVSVEGITNDKKWECGLEFDYRDDASFYVRPLTDLDATKDIRELNIVFLPPMSGLASREVRLETGAVNVRIGEGRTAEVLRNMCYNISTDEKKWELLRKDVEEQFGVVLETPVHIIERGEYEMSFMDIGGVKLDISCSGSGMRQVILLLSYIYSRVLTCSD